MKTLIIRIGYGAEYAISEEDAIRLLGIAQRCRAVRQTSDYKFYEFVPDGEVDPFVQGADLRDILVNDATIKDDKYTAATKDTAIPF